MPSRRLWAGWAGLLAQVERMTRRSDSEDLLHDAYVRMAARPERPDNEEAFLVRAAVNRAKDSYRREKVRGPPLATMRWRCCATARRCRTRR
ncbi:sigma factor [Sphingobium scionense]